MPATGTAQVKPRLQLALDSCMDTRVLVGAFSVAADIPLTTS